MTPLRDHDPERAGRIKARREELRLSQPALARRVGNVSTKTIYNWENRGVWMGWPHLEALARALRTSTDWIIGGEDADALPPADQPVSLIRAHDRQANENVADIRRDIADVSERLEGLARTQVDLLAEVRELRQALDGLRDSVAPGSRRGSGS